MNKYNITVTETCEANYVVEANSPEEADELFAEWVDRHSEYVSDDLLDYSYGWEYSKAEPVKMDCDPDITYEELTER